MPAIKSASAIAEKWARVTPGRSSDYRDGVTSPKKDWASNTEAAKDAYADGVTQSIANKSFEKGVKAAGTDKWKAKAQALGVPRWSQGIAAGKDDFSAGFAPFRDVIEKTTLPPRYRKGDPRNIDRVTKIATALHEAKVK